MTMELKHFCPDCQEERACTAGNDCVTLYTVMCNRCIKQRQEEDAIDDAMHNAALREEGK